MSTLSAPAAADEDRVLPVADIMARDPAHARLPHDARYEAGAAYVIDGFCALDEARVPITDLGFNRIDISAVDPGQLQIRVSPPGRERRALQKRV